MDNLRRYRRGLERRENYRGPHGARGISHSNKMASFRVGRFLFASIGKNRRTDDGSIRDAREKEGAYGRSTFGFGYAGSTLVVITVDPIPWRGSRESKKKNDTWTVRKFLFGIRRKEISRLFLKK